MTHDGREVYVPKPKKRRTKVNF